MRTSVVACVITALAAGGPALAGDYAVFCRTVADAGAPLLATAGERAGLLAAAGGGDVAFMTPAWALAALQAGRYVQQANEALVKIAAAVRRDGKQAGWMPWQTGGEPVIEATEMAAPVLAACLLWGGENLSDEARGALMEAMAAMGRAVGKARPSDPDLRTLTLAAACAAVGRAVGESVLVDRGRVLLADWLRDAARWGLVDGHGPRAEALRACMLQWLRVFADGTWSELDRARKVVWGDLLQRLVGPGRMLAGPQLFSSPAEAWGAQGPLREILALASAGSHEGHCRLEYVYYAMPFRGELPRLPGSAPVGVSRYTWSRQPLVEEYVCVTPWAALGVQTAPLNAASVPVHVAWATKEGFATYVAVSGPCHVAAVARGMAALVNFDFDGVGRGNRTQVWADVHIAPRQAVEEVRVLGQKWPGQAVAVDVGVPVAVSFGDRYLGLIPCWAGPAQAKEATTRVKPGVLQWTASGQATELVLRLYARQAAYPLRRPENNFVLGLFVVASGADEMSFEEFWRSLRGFRTRHVVQERKWRVPEKDEGHPILDRWKPKPKRAYAVDRALDYTLEVRFGGKTWLLTEDLYREQVSRRVAAGEEVAVDELQYNTPWLKIAPGWKQVEIAPALAELLAPLAEN